MFENAFVPNIAQDRMYKTIDTYASGTTQLYNLDPPKPNKPIGSMRSGFQLGGPRNIRHNIGYRLQEKYDFS